MVQFKHWIILLCINVCVALNTETKMEKPIGKNESEKPEQLLHVNDSFEKTKDIKTQIENDKPPKENIAKEKMYKTVKESLVKGKEATSENAKTAISEDAQNPAGSEDAKNPPGSEDAKPEASENLKPAEIEKPPSSEDVKSAASQELKPAASKNGNPSAVEDKKPVSSENPKPSTEKESQAQNRNPNSESAVLPEESEAIKKRLDIDIDESAQTGFYLLVGISASALVFVTFKIFSLRQSRARRRYGVRGNTTQELAPLPTSMESADSDEDDQTIFDRNRQQMRIF